MLFNSLPFLLFFIIFFGLYIITPSRYRLWLIILGSTLFYSYWNYYYVFLPHILAIMAYLGALWVSNGLDKQRKVRLGLVIILLLMPLFFIKYADFFYNEIVTKLFSLKSHNLHITLPLSLSFVTFTLLAYVIDIYHHRFAVERRLSRLMGLVLFFPHLIAGPILRPQDLLPQFNNPIEIRRQMRTRIIFGLGIFTVGLLKKVIFADQLANCVDPVYSAVNHFNGLNYLLAIYGFSVQLYCDFSGYTDMAIGLALTLGIRLPNNFDQPYCASSLVDFWRRWHITLSFWLRDYLYIALGGSRVRYDKQMINILITMGLGGLWHGANWTFLFWGLLHGCGIAFVHAYRKLKLTKYTKFVPQWIWVLLTFHFVTFVWIFFRAPTIKAAWTVFSGLSKLNLNIKMIEEFLHNNLFYIILLVTFFIFHRFDAQKKIRRVMSQIPRGILWLLLIMVWILAISFNLESAKNFIYFDF